MSKTQLMDRLLAAVGGIPLPSLEDRRVQQRLQHRAGGCWPEAEPVANRRI